MSEDFKALLEEAFPGSEIRAGEKPGVVFLTARGIDLRIQELHRAEIADSLGSFANMTRRPGIDC